MMELRPVGVGGVLAVLGNAIRSETGAQVAALREAVEHAHICGLEETVPAYALLVGNPARQMGWMSEYGHRLHFDKDGIAECPESKQRYRLQNGIVEKITE